MFVDCYLERSHDAIDIRSISDLQPDDRVRRLARRRHFDQRNMSRLDSAQLR